MKKELYEYSIFYYLKYQDEKYENLYSAQTAALYCVLNTVFYIPLFFIHPIWATVATVSFIPLFLTFRRLKDEVLKYLLTSSVFNIYCLIFLYYAQYLSTDFRKILLFAPLFIVGYEAAVFIRLYLGYYTSVKHKSCLNLDGISFELFFIIIDFIAFLLSVHSKEFILYSIGFLCLTMGFGIISFGKIQRAIIYLIYRKKGYPAPRPEDYY